MDKRHIGRKFWGNLGYVPGFDNVINSLPSKAKENVTAENNG
jgi:hypothetical protein